MPFSRPKVLMIIGGALVLLLLAIWIYLLFFRTGPAGEDRFADIDFANLGGLGEGTDPDARPSAGNTPNGGAGADSASSNVAGSGSGTETEPEQPRVALTDEPLQQLTTGPVVGFREITRSTSTAPTLLYMEAGTGHIYAIDMQTGALTRRSNTTIPNIQAAQFSADGTYVAGIIGDTREHLAFTARLDGTEQKLELTYLDDGVLEYAVPGTTELLYTTRSREGTTAKARDLATGDTRDLFFTPIRSLAIAWGESGGDTHYFHPRPSRRLEGFVAAVDGGTIRRLPIDGFGLTAVPTESGILYSYQTNEGVYGSRFLPAGESESRSTGGFALPQKCIPSSGEPDLVWCALELDEFKRKLPDDWYSGELVFTDTLYAIDTTRGSARRLFNLSDESGRTIDAVDLTANEAETALYFRNKLDNTLWYYDLR